MDIDTIIKQADRRIDKVSFYREKLLKLDGSMKTGVREELIKEIKSKGQVKLPNGEPIEYHITYDTVAHGLEPVYFWTLDYLRNDNPSGLGLDVDKTEEDIESTAGSSYFGEMGTRVSVMQDRAMKILATVNTVLRTIINLIYDLKEFEIRLETYDNIKSNDLKLKQAAEYDLRGLWMDQVDIKRGIGSINSLSTRADLMFVTLRDAFFQAESVHDVDKMDLNKRVKIILKRKLHEYFSWKDRSEVELRKRFSIERAYLRTQVNSMRLYTKWARPYLVAAQKLGMKEFRTKSGLPSPDMVSAFSNMQMGLSLMGRKEIIPSSVHPSYEGKVFNNKYYAVIGVDFKFRTIPQAMRAGGQSAYIHAGTIDIYFKPYVFTQKDLNDLMKEEIYQDLDLVDELTQVSMKELQDDLDRYLDPEKQQVYYKTVNGKIVEVEVTKKPVKDKKVEWPFGNIFKGFSELVVRPLKDLGGGVKGSFLPSGSYSETEVWRAAQEKALGMAVTSYDVFKKAHKMITW